MNKKMVPIRFPVDIDEMLDNWASCPDENVGWCLLCDSPIRNEQDLIQNTNTHNCAQGLRLELRGMRPER
jgi:hypothetical protein